MKLSKLWLGIKLAAKIVSRLEDAHVLPNGKLAKGVSAINAVDEAVTEITQK